jgi:hypothetical protein
MNHPPGRVSRNLTHEECARVVALQEERFTATYIAQRLHVGMWLIRPYREFFPASEKEEVTKKDVARVKKELQRREKTDLFDFEV